VSVYYEAGQTIATRVKNYDKPIDQGGVLVTPGGGAPACTVTRPDGTTAAATVATLAAGDFQASIASTIAGRYHFTYSASGTNSGAFPTTRHADVWPTGLNGRLIIPLGDAKDALNIPSSVSTDDNELRLYIAAATDYIENITGPLLSVTGKTWAADGGRGCVMLPEEAASITSVTVDGTATTDYTADLRAGIIYRGTGTSAGNLTFGAGRANVVVTYTVGGTTVPPAAVLAARELIRYWWQSSQQGGRPAFGGVGDSPTEPFFPSRRVAEILAPIADAMPGLA
jgi:hypothetical protein